MAVYQWRMTRRTGHHALDFPYPNCILRCKDGYIFVGAPEGHQWRQLLEVMGSPEWSKDPRFRNRTEMNNRYAEELDGYLESWLMNYTKAELLDIALKHRIPLAPVQGYDDVRLVRLLSHLGRSAGYVPIRGDVETHQRHIAGYGNSGAQSGYWPDHVPLPVRMGSHYLPCWYPYP